MTARSLELGIFTLEKRRLKINLITIFKHLKGCHAKEWEGLFSVVPDYRTRTNGLKRQESRFRLDMTKYFLRVVTLTLSALYSFALSLIANFQAARWAPVGNAAAVAGTKQEVGLDDLRSFPVLTFQNPMNLTS